MSNENNTIFLEEKLEGWKEADHYGALMIIQDLADAGFKKESAELLHQLEEEVEHYQDVINSQ